MCSSRNLAWSLAVLSFAEIGFGVSSITVGILENRRTRAALKMHHEEGAPVWSGVAFLICGLCGMLCARRRTGLMMIIFCACCICGLIGGILNVQFVRAAARRADFMSSLQIASISVACFGMVGCILSSWLTCRLASAEQQRMFLDRELSLHHSVEMTEKSKAGRSSSK
ncbi:transmembrane protein 196-like [Clupea harengus]|uniref:Transmembrane protein 196 n=1 Tax=Clupea harengus TaxID=7950 RepID=A0A6P8G1A6_CLUHA|nr:transmembrane protein 196-like [Clupea harengus]